MEINWRKKINLECVVLIIFKKIKYVKSILLSFIIIRIRIRISLQYG